MDRREIPVPNPCAGGIDSDATGEFGFAGAPGSSAEPATSTEQRSGERLLAIPAPSLDANAFGRGRIETLPSGGAHEQDVPRHSESDGLDLEPRYLRGKYTMRGRIAVGGAVVRAIDARIDEVTATLGDVAWDEPAKR